MSVKKLKKLLIICLVILFVLILVPNIFKSKEKKEKVENNTQQFYEINIEETHNFENINYNNLSKEEMNFLNDKYMGTARFTRKGSRGLL